MCTFTLLHYHSNVHSLDPRAFLKVIALFNPARAETRSLRLLRRDKCSPFRSEYFFMLNRCFYTAFNATYYEKIRKLQSNVGVTSSLKEDSAL